MGCVVSLIFSNQDFIQQVEEVSKKQMKWREPAALKILKVVECVHAVTQVLYSLQAAVTIQDSVYELQKLRLLQEEPGTDTDCRVEGDVLSMCSTDLERREREELEAELQLWAQRSEVLKEEEAEIERERRRVQQQERQIRKEKERMRRKLRLSQQNSTNRQRSLSFIVPTDK
ncbi:rho guanine nucleotide exchange factor 28-like [Trichomycterus rosablanca]|uniref:rho guanine nucleotide exchange factor 28-like n=1 Tax=Trichomycterus rosablanca TaxID=2290929 RepID=UPI002F358B00